MTKNRLVLSILSLLISVLSCGFMLAVPACGGDDADLQEVYDTERHLLYVACTRARDHLLVTSVEPASEFLDDMRSC